MVDPTEGGAADVPSADVPEDDVDAVAAQPGHPEDAVRPEDGDRDGGAVPEAAPDPMQLEPARLLANEVRPTLRDRGVDDEQIERWARSYVAIEGSGDAERFLAWVAVQQREQS